MDTPKETCASSQPSAVRPSSSVLLFALNNSTGLKTTAQVDMHVLLMAQRNRGPAGLPQLLACRLRRESTILSFTERGNAGSQLPPRGSEPTKANAQNRSANVCHDL